MSIVRQKWITRKDLRDNPNQFYVFGDNVQRSGFGGQAKEMRGEPNAIGVATKWSPSMDSRAFFDDTLACRAIVERDLLTIDDRLRAGKTVVVPTDGIGTGLSQLPQRAPNLHHFIEGWFTVREKKIGLGRCPTCGEPGHMMEKRPNGYTFCIEGHSHPSTEFR
ncbi:MULTISPECIES: hypothetical protein [unclassified Bradyrhizobium]|uniref:DUF7831 domain-containing protein n=1 Tax=unclassified Bradyrhizobium TaxID=2631580 RepID=UPI00291686A3|nr:MULTISPECIES: hypothetical protein [unclassified Bradyrhizobium]